MGVNISGFSGLYDSSSSLPPSSIPDSSPDFNRLIDCSFLDAPLARLENSPSPLSSPNATYLPSFILQRTIPNFELSSEETPSLNFEEGESMGEKGYLTPEEVKTLPVVQYNSKMNTSTCIICLANFEDTSRLKILPCFHYFHKDCIVAWLETSIHCPICQYTI